MRSPGARGTIAPMLERLIEDLQRDAHRPWWRRTSGGLLVLVVLAAILGGVAADLVR